MSLKKMIKGIINDVNDIIEIMEHKQQHPDSPDINELVERVIGDIPDADLEAISDNNDDEYDELWRVISDKDYHQEKLLKEYWSKDYIELDRISGGWKKLSDSELLDGEISASVNTIGRFIVRSSLRAYETSKDDDNFAFIPADSRIIQHFKGINESLISHELSRNEFRDVHLFYEIHFMLKNGSSYKRLAKAKVPRSMAWTEEITAIYLAKENNNVPDEKASLIAHVLWVGSAHHSNTWYKADNCGNITRLYDSGYTNSDDIRFEEFDDEL